MEYEEYEQRCDESFYMNLPDTVKEYEKNCDFQMKNANYLQKSWCYKVIMNLV
jgi:hypothetical protein